jgi:hypothetical protein
MLRKGGAAAGYGFGGSLSHELPRPNGSRYGSSGGKKGAAARRKRLLSRLGVVVIVLFLVGVLVTRSRSGGNKGGAGGSAAANLHQDGEGIVKQHVKSDDTAAAAEKR